MMLVGLIVLPLLGGVLALFFGRHRPAWPRWISLVTLLIDLILAVAVALFSSGGDAGRPVIPYGGPWLLQIDWPWIPHFGIHFHLAMDGLSLVMVLLTAFLGLVAILSAWTEIRERVGFFYFNLLWVLAGITGVFLALDLFLFYFFWEMMLVPMYFIIAIWGHANRVYAAAKFFLFTQLSGLLMLVAIVALYFIHGQTTGVYTFDYPGLLGTAMSPATAKWLMLGFALAFAVKLPAVPVHTWLPDAHTEAPTPGSVILAGLLLKTGAYGMIRFAVPLFPGAAADFAPAAMVIGVFGILYGGVLAFAQNDLKRLVAYTSVSHMGFVLLGIFAWNATALNGVVLQMVCHGISTGALFALAGALQERIHTRELSRMGGLWATAPRMGAAIMIFSLASLGLPGLGNFVAEFMVLMGSFRVSVPITVVAALGLIPAAVYSLWIVQRVMQGPNPEGWKIIDLAGREMVMTGALAVVIIWLGIFPQPVLDTVAAPIHSLERIVRRTEVASIPGQMRSEATHRLSGMPTPLIRSRGGKP
jgi:NADH-quinone oxidoreductase subunit M